MPSRDLSRIDSHHSPAAHPTARQPGRNGVDLGGQLPEGDLRAVLCMDEGEALGIVCRQPLEDELMQGGIGDLDIGPRSSEFHAVPFIVMWPAAYLRNRTFGFPEGYLETPDARPAHWIQPVQPRPSGARPHHYIAL